ncbi:MAG: substrate-binding domain-containing protein [Gemmatimonadota bacterium]|nr:MAG: substrate-binding domain-containing protein [Gemmatimonadota bacterium]
MRRRRFIKNCFAILAVVIFLTSSAASTERIKMATTTSTDNSGLLQVLVPPFEDRFQVTVDVIAVGTGKALKLGENGDVDLVLVHAREAEDRFIEIGYGVNRRDVMYNDFVMVGPENDPAGIKGTRGADALKRIATSQQPFYSRGDESGTHAKEKNLWEVAEIIPHGKWYVETGQGKGTTLQMANEKNTYCLVDRGTFIAFEKKLDLVILCEGDERLFNPYGIIAVNPHRHPHVNYFHAMAFIGWVTSPEGQKIIGDFKKDGKILFHPNAYP